MEEEYYDTIFPTGAKLDEGALILQDKYEKFRSDDPRVLWEQNRSAGMPKDDMPEEIAHNTARNREAIDTVIKINKSSTMVFMNEVASYAGVDVFNPGTRNQVPIGAESLALRGPADILGRGDDAGATDRTINMAIRWSDLMSSTTVSGVLFFNGRLLGAVTSAHSMIEHDLPGVTIDMLIDNTHGARSFFAKFAGLQLVIQRWGGQSKHQMQLTYTIRYQFRYYQQ